MLNNMQFWLGRRGGADLIFKYKIGLIFRPSYPLAYINLHVTCNMWKYSKKDFRAFDEVFVDTVEVAA